ncbi:hypothetical protein KKF05_01055 [Patescibacteria group bacterium]|nr:hypothetical protein [Patescibacteria group bacterium]MBU1915973.1 hypothetical protein [Patescibacteria group bacterium]
MKKFWQSLLTILMLMAGAAAFVALYLATWRLVSGEPLPQHSETPIFWFWSHITVHLNHNRWLDPLWAAIWVIVPGLLLIDRVKFDDIELVPVYGLAAAGGLYLAFWGEPGLIMWPTMVFPAFIIGRIINLLNRSRAEQAGVQPPVDYNLSYSLAFVFAFGFGLFIPQALTYGFYWAGYLFYVYCVIGLIFCSLVFSVLYIPRPFIWLYRRLRPA